VLVTANAVPLVGVRVNIQADEQGGRCRMLQVAMIAMIYSNTQNDKVIYDYHYFSRVFTCLSFWGLLYPDIIKIPFLLPF
jgi:hypothetical protein